MLGITLFYILFLVLLILIIFLILLYSGYHSRTLAPPLLDSFYGFTIDSGASISTTFNKLYLNDGENVEDAANGVSGGIDFGASGVTGNNGALEFAFKTMYGDQQRKLKGNITLLINSADSSGSKVELQLKDQGNSNDIISGPTDYFVRPTTDGIQEIKLYFTANKITSGEHRFFLEGRGVDGGVSANTLLLNSAYLYYY